MTAHTTEPNPQYIYIYVTNKSKRVTMYCLCAEVCVLSVTMRVMHRRTHPERDGDVNAAQLCCFTAFDEDVEAGR